MPADSFHNVVALTGEDLVYLTAKDTTFGIHGIPRTARRTGGFYDPAMARRQKRTAEAAPPKPAASAPQHPRKELHVQEMDMESTARN
jgi:hypothetical protein